MTGKSMEDVHRPYGPYEKYFKRPLDICCALVAILLFWWLYIIIAISVRVKLGSPVLFKQDRPGKNERIFKLYKFRTMTDEHDEEGKLLSDEMRLSKFGRWLRSTSLDELPSLWNIVKGDLAICGPRPLLVEYLPRYSADQHRRHEVRPGLTGYAQVYGRNMLTWKEKFEKDIFYVDHVSFWLDIKIIFKTIGVVLKREGISSETSATMESFVGIEESNGRYSNEK